MSSYQLPQRVYDAKVYPVKAPNDSTIIIYSHDLGIKILWRGGRRYKPKPPAPPAPAKSKANGAKGDDVIMISDSDDEDEPAAQDTGKSADTERQLEEEDEELDPGRPFPNILRSVDIPLGVKVLSLAIPNASPEAAPSSLESCPAVLSGTMVVAAACADSSTRVVSLPLAPPVDDEAAPVFQILTINAGSVHNIPASVAITVTNSDYQARSRSHSRSRQSSPSKKAAGSWELLLATHTREAIGTLSIYRIPLIRQTKDVYAVAKDPVLPFQQEFLASPANSISFIPSQYPSDRHSNLLVSFASGHVKIYSCLSVKSRRPASDRRPSMSGDRRESRQFEGKWLITLSTDFDQTSAAGRRKSIVDAKWVLGGNAIIALQSDGEWGVWDLENADSDSRSRPSTPGAAAAGRSPSSFAVTGRVLASEKSATNKNPPPSDEPRPKFAPMTPSTRRIREDALFKGSMGSAPQHHATTRGGITVKRANVSWDQPWDETVVIWHGSKNVQIPSLLSYWRTSARQLAYDTSSSLSKPATIKGISFHGQAQNGICYLPNYSKFSSSTTTDDAGPDILLVAEYQLIILSLKHAGKEDRDRKRPRIEQQRLHAAAADDEARLGRGELDISGMDRMLASMAGSSSQQATPTPRGMRLFS